MPLPAITRVSNMEIKSNAKNKENGLRIDAITTAQRNAIPTKTSGLLVSNSTTNTLQTYQNDTWGDLHTSASFFALKRTSTAISYQALITDVIIGVTSTAAARTITLPAIATTTVGQIFIVKDESNAAGTNNITIQGDANINGAATLVINANSGSARLYSTGALWFTY